MRHGGTRLSMAGLFDGLEQHFSRHAGGLLDCPLRAVCQWLFHRFKECYLMLEKEVILELFGAAAGIWACGFAIGKAVSWYRALVTAA